MPPSFGVKQFMSKDILDKKEKENNQQLTPSGCLFGILFLEPFHQRLEIFHDSSSIHPASLSTSQHSNSIRPRLGRSKSQQFSTHATKSGTKNQSIVQPANRNQEKSIVKKNNKTVTPIVSRLLGTDRYRTCAADRRDRKFRTELCAAGIGARN